MTDMDEVKDLSSYAEIFILNSNNYTLNKKYEKIFTCSSKDHESTCFALIEFCGCIKQMGKKTNLSVLGPTDGRGQA